MAEAALERLREAIIMGELTPGTPLRLEDLALGLARAADPPGVGQLRAIPAGPALGPRRAAAAARAARRGAARGLRGARRRPRRGAAPHPPRPRDRVLRRRAQGQVDLRALTA